MTRLTCATATASRLSQRRARHSHRRNGCRRRLAGGSRWNPLDSAAHGFGDEKNFLRYLGYHTAAYIFDDPQIYDYLHNRFCLTDTADRQMGFYGLRDGKVAAFTLHRSPDPALPEDTQQAMHEAYSSLGWVVPRALERCPTSSELYYDQVAQIEIPQWSRGRVTLVGDACQAVSLLAGQGASLAIAGAYVLGDQLASANSVDAALAHYQQLWQPVITEKQQVARRGVGWFLPSSSLQLWLRRIVLRLTNLPGVAKYVSTTLAGKSHASIEKLSREAHAALPVTPTSESRARPAPYRAATSSSCE